MKKLLLIAACLAFLAGCTKEDNVVRQKANLATKATQAHLNIQFMSFGNTLNFYIPEWDRYELTRVAITLYNVYIWPGAESPPIFNTSTWQYVTSQVIIAEASLSENALIHLTPESYMDATGTTITELDYKSLGLKVYNEFEDSEDDGKMTSIEIYGTSKLQTARGIKIGSSKEEVLKAYPSNSILKSDSVDENTIIVGYPGSEPVYGSEKGNIYYFVKNGKISRILLAYAIAE